MAPGVISGVPNGRIKNHDMGVKSVNEFNLLLARLLRESGMEQKELAEKCSLSKELIGLRVRNETNATPRLTTVEAIAKQFNLPVEQLRAVLNGTLKADDVQIPHTADNEPKTNDGTLAENFIGSPRLVMKIASGNWIPMHDCKVRTDAKQVGEQAAALISQLKHPLFKIEISGDAMEPIWPHESLVLFRAIDLARQIPNPGNDYFFQLRDGRTTFMRMGLANESSFTARAINLSKYSKQVEFRRELLVRAAVAEYIMLNPRDMVGTRLSNHFSQ